MRLNNLDVRKAIEKKRVRHYEIAEKLGIDRCTFSIWLQKEMSPERKKAVLNAIKEL